jgi:uncharacterized protein YndB with AHSA1/START domain
LKPRRIVLFFVLGLAGLVGSIGLVMPNSFSVTRSIETVAPIGEVFETVSDMTRHPLWNARKMRDDSMRFSFPGANHKGKGATYEWTSKQSGSGRCTIIDAEQNEHISILVELFGKGEGDALWTFENKKDRTKITRTFQGSINVPIIGPWLVLIARPQDSLGADFDQELVSLKRIVEGAKAGP